MSTQSHNRKDYRHAALMRYANMLGFGDIHVKHDRSTGLHSIAAIHSVDRGPAIGGCRYYAYKSSGQALLDALRLAYMMTLKAAISDLPHGGAKSVIIAPKKAPDREALFHAFGDFVDGLDGRYITACDVGTNTDDMDIIATRTPYVIGAAKTNPQDSNPGPHTALGVFLGMRAAIQYKQKRDSFDGVRVAIQGAGSVSHALTKLLVADGAHVTVCDPLQSAVDQLKDEFNVQSCPVDAIYDIDCDIFSPCALGGTISPDSIKRINAPIIAGSANNQLTHLRVAELLREQGRLYVPDFVINSGGLINAAIVYGYQDATEATKKIKQLEHTLFNLYETAHSQNINTLLVARHIALTKIAESKDNPEL